MEKQQFKHDIGLSFAGEQRDYVREFADELVSRGIRVFFDDYEKPGLWGKNLYSHLSEIYGKQCRYCILFASVDCARKVWPNHEREAAQARALKESREFILPVRFDDTPIPGLLDSVHYIDLRTTSLQELVQLTVEKLGNPQRSNYLPPELDRLFGFFDVTDDPTERNLVHSRAVSFFSVLQRMTLDERKAVLVLLRDGCCADLPDNVHIDTDLLRRASKMSESRLGRLLGGIRSLGFSCSVRRALEEKQIYAHSECKPLGESYFFELEWVDLGNFGAFPALPVAYAMVQLASEHYCDDHATECLDRLDFSQLSSATRSIDSHKTDEPVETLGFRR